MERIRKIMDTVCEEYGIGTEELFEDNRTQRASEPRQLAMYLARNLCGGMSLAEIGEAFGRTYATVIHNVKVAGYKIELYADSRNHYLSIINKLKEYDIC